VITQLLLPDHEVDHVINLIVEHGKLHMQSTGAVFSTPCEQVYIGSEFHNWPVDIERRKNSDAHTLKENLSAIFCIVERNQSDAVSRAAIDAGAHGPIVFHGEGRGLRDRLGWLRISKQSDKEILTVIADNAEADAIFDAMSQAGSLHLPGHGFMFRVPIDKGMFNLPSRFSKHRYAANMQQIISAIDHLNGHNHWRDQTVFEVCGNGKGAGLGLMGRSKTTRFVDDQVCLSGITNRDQADQLMDLLLDAGAPGLNVNYTRFMASDTGCVVAGARVNNEYARLRCVTDDVQAANICAAVEAQAERVGIHDLCMYTQRVPRVATYIPGAKDFRANQTAAIAQPPSIAI
ncbi:MAG: hypothetical protein ACR2PS_15070, partial [Pseudomonadales bacterium]